MNKHSKNNHIFNLLLVLTIALILPVLTFAQGRDTSITVTPLTPESTFHQMKVKPVQDAKMIGTPQQDMVSVIVRLKGESLLKYSGGVPGLAPTNPQVTGAPLTDLKSWNIKAYLQHLAEQHTAFESMAMKIIPQVQAIHRFDVILNAVSMLVPPDQVKTLADLPDVEAVYPDELLQLNTNNSPQFIGAPTAWNVWGGQEWAGQGVIVGVLDTGIWPEHPSFSDPDPSGKRYSAPPTSLSGNYCQFTGGPNPGPVFTCNNKLIGARRFMNTYQALIPLLPGEYTSARDDDGHGTHTSSTATGNAGVQASIFGVPRGTVSGIAPRAHVIMYKVCGASGCFSSDSAAAVQQAILDGVDVINFSISGGTNPFTDAVELAFLNAYEAGIFVAASAGNAGPGPDTTDHRGPWVTTVAASTQNRAFQTTATVTSSGSARLSLIGASITQGITTPKPVVVAPDPFCIGPYALGTFTGKVVVCERGGGASRAGKGFNVLQGGAAGMILYNQATNVTDLETDNHFLPTVHIQYNQGQALLNFLSANTGVQVTWPAGTKVPAQGDVMASFSSRGGPDQSLGVSKPDITAPGVQILAGHSPQHLPPPAGVALGPQGELFQAIAGTSMSSPHIAGSAALLKALHPDWTPGQIKSALMTTAKTSVVKEDGVTPATPFDDGSGRVDLTKAWNPGLTFNETASNYVALQNELWNANYPSVYLPVMPGIITVQRTAHSELIYPSCWIASVDSPPDVTVTVPPLICVPGHGNKTFDIKINGHDVPLGQARHAMLKLKFGLMDLHLPITFVRKQPVVTLTKTCDPGTIRSLGITHCTITAQNNSFDTANVKLTDVLPSKLLLVPGSVVGGVPGKNSVAFNGAISSAVPPDVSIGTGNSPAGYLPLSSFGVAPIAGVGDETIVNFNVPAFTCAGETYNRVGMVSNGYLVVGGGTGADIQFLNQNLPNPTHPNNVLSPFWTDLNPGAGGALRIAVLTDGSDQWIVADWEAVKEYSTTKTNSFQIWIGVNSDTHPGEDISFVYGTLQGNGDGGKLTVGAENRFGNRGQNYYYNGTGTLPTNTTELLVTGTPPAPGETHVTTFSAKGILRGNWENCAQMEADIVDGVNTACFNGRTN